MQPRMIVAAGPPGSGKSSAFPVQQEAVDFFNADERASELNGASYRRIPESIRAQVNQEFENFVLAHISEGQSFAIETTLRSDVTFRQARLAKTRGFLTIMTFVALSDVLQNIERVSARADAGGHSASYSRLREVHKKSLANLPRALGEFDGVDVYDNSEPGEQPRLVLAT
jgi:predicted ABC-type ATPase